MPENSIENLQKRKKSKKVKICVKTERQQEYRRTYVRPEVSGIKFISREKQERNDKLRHTSMITRNPEKKNSQLHSTLPLHRKVHNQTAMERKLPQIYQPQPNSVKMLNIDIEKYVQKSKGSSTSVVIENKKMERVLNDQRIVHSGRKSMKFKGTELQPLKQLDKEEKSKIFKLIRNQFNELINSTNNLTIKNNDCHFRAYIDKGNNGILIKEVMKKRWWWHIEEKDRKKANLVWSQWLNKSLTQEMKENENENKSTIYHDYKMKNSDESKTIKESSIKKIVDEFMFSKIKEKINFQNNNYFRTAKNNQTESKQMTIQHGQLIHNHVQGCLQLHSKKLLFKNFCDLMKKKNWNPFQFIPLTFYIDQIDSPAVSQLLSAYDQNAEKKTNRNIWICKPGENSNRGFGITVVKERNKIIREIQQRLADNTSSSEKRTVIFQKYLENCFLIKNRKFDIRCFVLLTTVNGILKGYWFRDGYIRTSSEEYNLEDIDNVMIHLTNDAVQQKGQSFGRYEDFNKMTFEGFKKYLIRVGENPQKFDETYEQMKLIAYYMIASVSQKIKRKQFTFQLFGLDYMLDSNLSPFLIQANSNPSLENRGKIMGSLIPHLIDNVVMTAIDPLFPPPTVIKKKSQYVSRDYFEYNSFQLIFTDKNFLLT